MLMSVATAVWSSHSWPTTDPFVLLVDDHRASLDWLRNLLEGRGYRCVTALSASQAMTCFEGRCPSLVVTDLNMPRLDGACFARGLKSRYPKLPIVLLTSESFNPEMEASLRESFVAIVRKPLDVEPFLKVISELCPVGRRCEGA
ncbi:MAG: response regulator [Isosphaeraceae bacterium]